MSLPRYPAYRRSGIQWLEEVPAHWNRPAKLGAISSLKGRLGWQGLKADEYRDHGPYVVSSAHFSEFKIRWAECPRVSQQRYETDDNIQLASGDVLLMKDGAAMGKLAFVDDLPGKACLNSHLLLFRPLFLSAGPAYLPKFAFYFMQTGYFQEHIKINGTGATFLGISQDAIAKYQVVWPQLPEQEEIVDFLDCETIKIDALIAEQERLIALLAEKRQATICHAVTRGLEPNAQVKHSGVVAMGEVPAHWHVLPLRRLFGEIGQGWSPNAGAEPRVNDEWAVLKISAIKNGRFVEKENKALLEGTVPDEALVVLPGDLLLTRANTPDLVGDCCVVPDGVGPHLMISDLIYRIKLTPDADARFVCYFLVSVVGRAQIKSDARGSSMTMAKISQAHISAWQIAVPPNKEQIAIVAYLDHETSKLESLKMAAERVITLLKERRGAVIAAAVTGQIDVRRQVKAPADRARGRVVSV